jgi:protoporphyrinogen oxidase
MTSNPSVLIIGAGPAGLATAWGLKEAGVPCIILERSSRVGGLSHSLSLWGYEVDVGPHTFYSNGYPESLRFLKHVLGNELEITHPLKGIFYRGKVLEYPFKPLDFLQKAGLPELLRVAVSRGISQLQRQQHFSSSADIFSNRYGTAAYHRFFLPYCIKYFGHPPNAIDTTFVQLLCATRNAESEVSRPYLLSPLGGSGYLWQKTANLLTQGSVDIQTNVTLSKLLNDGQTIYAAELEDGTKIQVSQVISTIPLKALLQLIGQFPSPILAAADRLQTRSTVLIYLNLKHKTNLRFHYLTSFDNDHAFGRITFYKNWWPQTYVDYANEVVALEYWCGNDSELLDWSDERLAEMACVDFAKTGIVTPEVISDTHVLRLRGIIPVPHVGYQTELNLVLRSLSQFSNLHIAGRAGRFRWDGQEDGIREGLAIGQKIAALHTQV